MYASCTPFNFNRVQAEKNSYEVTKVTFPSFKDDLSPPPPPSRAYLEYSKTYRFDCQMILSCWCVSLSPKFSKHCKVHKSRTLSHQRFIPCSIDFPFECCQDQKKASFLMRRHLFRSFSPQGADKSGESLE